ncbi:MAG: 3'-5' exonuclease [Castellaniella sp.]
MSHRSLSFPLERLAEIQTRPLDFRLLERIPLTCPEQTWPLSLGPAVGDERPMVLLDTETTGLEAADDAIIELGMVRLRYSPSAHRLVSVEATLSLYEDPGRPIPEFITRLTGITDAMVSGQRMDDAQVAAFLDGDPLIVAHNAGFDRPFFERRFSTLDHLPWACSAYGVDWSELGFESRKLEYLLLRLGWFYDGHRATNDTLAMAWLFHRMPAALEALLVEARRTTVRVQAFGAPFDVKDALRERGYRWHNGTSGPNRHWWCEVDAAALGEEQAFLDALYHNGSEQAHYVRRTAWNRFKDTL